MPADVIFILAVVFGVIIGFAAGALIAPLD